MTHLEPGSEVPGRPFTDPQATRSDLAIMERMLGRLRRHLEELVAAANGDAPRDDRLTDEDDGGNHHIVVTDVARTRTGGEMVVVGFFGQARMDVDHQPIIDLEAALIADMPANRTPLVYYNVHWPGTGWGNLVIFGDQAAKDGWGHDPRHAEAVDRSPRHYHSVRLHIGTLPGGIVGGQGIQLRWTRYLDYSGPEPWKAVRKIG
jgi:hypothetical protein